MMSIAVRTTGCEKHKQLGVKPIGWPNGVPDCPECLIEWVIKHSRALEKMANPPTLGIGITESVKASAKLR